MLLFGSAYAQRVFKIRGEESQKVISRRHRAACYLSEKRERKVYQVCNKLYTEALEEITIVDDDEKWRQKVSRYYKKGPVYEKDKETGIRPKEAKAAREYRLAQAPKWINNCQNFGISTH